MAVDIQVVITLISTLVASGAIWQLARLRSDIEQIRATTRKVETEAHALETQQLRTTADFYYEQWQRCLEAEAIASKHEIGEQS